MNTKPFNLQAALAGAPVVTLDGNQVMDLVVMKSAHEHSRLVGTINGHLWGWYESGKSYQDSEVHMDLRMAPRKVTRWACMHPASLVFGPHRETQAEAEQDKDTGEVVCRIEWEE